MKFKEFGSVFPWVVEECLKENGISDSVDGQRAEAYHDTETGSLYIFVHNHANVDDEGIKLCGYLFEYFTWCFDLADDSSCDRFRDERGVILLNHLVRPDDPEPIDDEIIII